MAYLLDTNILLRLAERTHPSHPVVRAALRKLRAAGEAFYFAPQNIAEFWCVATRPLTSRGGLDLSLAAADRELRKLERLFTLLPDDPAVFAEWRGLLLSVGVSGVQVYDARLAASMRVAGIAHILTFNTTDFKRYPGITAVDPADV